MQYISILCFMKRICVESDFEYEATWEICKCTEFRALDITTIRQNNNLITFPTSSAVLKKLYNIFTLNYLILRYVQCIKQINFNSLNHETLKFKS